MTASAAPRDDSSHPTSETKPSVRWSGQLVAVYEYTDLDTTPTSRTWNGGGDLQSSWGTPKGSTVTAYFQSGAQGVVVEAGAETTSESCATAVSTQGVDSIDVEPGMRLCVVTDAGRSALLQVKSVDAGNDEFTAQLTVWQK